MKSKRTSEPKSVTMSKILCKNTNKYDIKCSSFLKENVFERKLKFILLTFSAQTCIELLVEVTITSSGANSLTFTVNIYIFPIVHISPFEKQIFIVSSLLSS